MKEMIKIVFLETNFLVFPILMIIDLKEKEENNDCL
jgi:hypothetical protein